MFLSFLVLSIFVLDIIVPLGFAAGVPYVIPVLLSAKSKNRNSILSISALCILLIIIGAFLSPGDLASWEVLANRALAITMLGLISYFSYQFRDLYFKHEDSRSRIDNLEKFVTICSYCNKEKIAENKWVDHVEYFTNKHGMQFSHGICEECIEEDPEYKKLFLTKSN